MHICGDEVAMIAALAAPAIAGCKYCWARLRNWWRG